MPEMCDMFVMLLLLVIELKQNCAYVVYCER